MVNPTIEGKRLIKFTKNEVYKQVFQRKGSLDQNILNTIVMLMGGFNGTGDTIERNNNRIRINLGYSLPKKYPVHVFSAYGTREHNVQYSGKMMIDPPPPSPPPSLPQLLMKPNVKKASMLMQNKHRLSWEESWESALGVIAGLRLTHRKLQGQQQQQQKHKKQQVQVKFSTFYNMFDKEALIASVKQTNSAEAAAVRTKSAEAAVSRPVPNTTAAVSEPHPLSFVALGLLPYVYFPRGLQPFESSNSTDKGSRVFGDSTDLNVTVLAEEWRSYAENACIWHMLTSKSGEAKTVAMRRDGAHLLGHEQPA